MTHTYEELKKKNVTELREIAKGIEHDAVQGYTQLNKDKLVPAICEALGIDAREHHVASGVNKADVKARIKALKVERDQALEAHDHAQLKRVRREIHRLKHTLRKAAV